MTGDYLKDRALHRFSSKLFAVLTIIAFVTICVALNYKTLELQKQEAVYAEQLSKAQKKLDEETERSVAIEERKAYVQTKKFAEEVAREKFGMVYKNEIIFTPKK